MRYDETGHDEAWRNKLAAQMNVLLDRVDYFRETSNDESDQAAEAATMAILERVARFEEISVRLSRGIY